MQNTFLVVSMLAGTLKTPLSPTWRGAVRRSETAARRRGGAHLHAPGLGLERCGVREEAVRLRRHAGHAVDVRADADVVDAGRRRDRAAARQRGGGRSAARRLGSRSPLSGQVHVAKPVQVDGQLQHAGKRHRQMRSGRVAGCGGPVLRRGPPRNGCGNSEWCTLRMHARGRPATPGSGPRARPRRESCGVHADLAGTAAILPGDKVPRPERARGLA